MFTPAKGGGGVGWQVLRKDTSAKDECSKPVNKDTSDNVGGLATMVLFKCYYIFFFNSQTLKSAS